jgi:hypothetical protein
LIYNEGVRKYLFIAILSLAFLLRVVDLDRFPSGFTPDEASFGYDAYSILKTGRDQWGVKFPLVLKSFGDYKSPLYTYLTIPSVAAFGLNKIAVRLPNALLGVLAVFVVYLLTGEIGRLLKLGEKENIYFQITAALFLSISSWHIMLSRGAFEANLITLFLPLGIYFFLKKNYFISALIFGLNLFSYHSAKVLTPVIFLGLIYFFRKRFLTDWKKILISFFIFAAFFIVMVYTLTIGGAARISERSITGGALEEGARIKIALIQKGVNPILARVLHNKYQVVANRFITNYSQYFSFRFLFKDGPAETTYGMLPGLGVIYGFEGLLILGIIPIIFQRKYLKVVLIILVWLFISPVPAALATGVGFSANRAVAMIPSLQIIEALGVFGWWFILRKFNRKTLAVLTFILSFWVAKDINKYFKAYYYDSPKISARGMSYGNLEVGYWLKENVEGKVAVISKTLSEPHIYIAFANSWDPADYQEQTKSWRFDESGVNWVDQIPNYSLGRYVFQNVDWKVNIGKPNSLLVGRPEQFLPSDIPTKIFNYPDGSDAIFVVDSNKQIYAKGN